VLTYLFRSIKARWLENLALIVVYTVIVATGTLIVSFASNIRDLAVVGGNPNTVVVMSPGASTLSGSSVGKEAYDRVRVRPEIAQQDTSVLVSPEFYITTQLRTTKGLAISVGVRGIDPVAFMVHDTVHIIKGRAPAPGSDEIVIGQTLEGVFAGFNVGGDWHRHPIVGVFQSNKSILEQEVWIDRQQLFIELGRRANALFGFLYVKTKSPADAAAFVDWIANSKQNLAAFTEPQYLKNISGDSEGLVRLAMGFSLLLALGAGIASINTLYSSLLGRLPEFAALHAIGVKRRGLAGLVLQESLLLALIGVALGIAIALALNGQHISRLWTDHPFEQIPLNVGSTSVTLGTAVGIVVGVAGGLLAGLSVFRVDMSKYR
jgi:putative ABC transport system permease protein